MLKVVLLVKCYSMKKNQKDLDDIFDKIIIPFNIFQQKKPKESYFK